MPSLDYYNHKLPHNTLREAADITADEQARLRAQFAPTIASYRRHVRWVWLTMAIGVVLFIISGALGYGFCGFIPIAMIIAMVIAFHAPPLCCPNCDHRIDKCLGPFCPECGRRAVNPGGFFTSPKCTACRRTLRSKQGHCRIRACTHCGLWVDDWGVATY